jgi:hypothetical protein
MSNFSLGVFRFRSNNPEKGGKVMENKIHWGKDLKAAIPGARAQNKPILLFFHNPN